MEETAAVPEAQSFQLKTPLQAFSGGAPLPPRLEIKTTRSEEKPAHRNGGAPQGGARHSRRKISAAFVANRPYRN
jgi:hypothetical protein